MGKYQKLAHELSITHGYHDDMMTLTLGLCEEAGEVAKAINYHHNPLYVRSPHSRPPDSVEHEMKDVLIYLAALANTLGIDLEI